MKLSECIEARLQSLRELDSRMQTVKTDRLETDERFAERIAFIDDHIKRLQDEILKANEIIARELATKQRMLDNRTAPETVYADLRSQRTALVKQIKVLQLMELERRIGVLENE